MIKCALLRDKSTAHFIIKKEILKKKPKNRQKIAFFGKKL